MNRDGSNDAPTPESWASGGESPVAVVGIGASAGGMEPLREILAGCPADLGLAVVVLLHLPPDSDSRLPDVLRQRSALPVVDVEDGMRAAAGAVYVAAPGVSLTIEEGRFRLRDTVARTAVRRLPIDDFFHSLAEDCGERSAAVVLSGSGADGSLGIRSIEARGGLVLVQDPATTRFDGMPKSAVGTGLADAVLPPAEIAGALAGFAEHLRDGEPATPPSESPESHLERLFTLVENRAGHDLRLYRKPTTLRRIARRMGVRRVDELGRYVELLDEEPGELRALVRDLLIHVTSFFRDPEDWEALEEHVVRPLIAQREPGASLRFWVPACASGEEAYSLAILVAGELERVGKRLDVKIFATDVADHILETARSGVFPKSLDASVPRRHLERWFEDAGAVYRIRQEIRDLLVLAPHDLLQHPPFSRLDLVCCRNFLIYIEPEAQCRVLALLHFSLRDPGYLFLGRSESVGQRGELFERALESRPIYRRLPPSRPDLVSFPHFRVAPGGPPVAAEPAELDVPRLARQLLVERYAPPSVLVDAHHRVLYFHGATAPYLEQPSGEPSRDLMTLSHEALRPSVSQAFRQAMEGGGTAQAVASSWSEGGRWRPVTVTVASIERSGPRLFLVGFEEADRGSSPLGPAGSDLREAAEPDEVVEGELRRTREELRHTVGHLEASNEELRASNEEVTSVNEELQSTNEELESSKEELQSMNEELSAVNDQLAAKVEELERTSNDLANLLHSTSVATLFLGRDLAIRRYTPAMRDLVDLLPGDVGRPIAHLARKFDDGELEADARRVLRDLTAVESEIEAEDGRWFLRRVMPYRTEDERIEGVVVTFVDITEQRRAAETLRDLAGELEEQVSRRTSELRLFQAVAAVANEARSIEEALSRTLTSVVNHNGWLAAVAYAVDDGRLSPEPLAEVSSPQVDAAALDRSGVSQEGAAARVAATGEPVWAVELDGRITGEAEEPEIGSVLAFPIRGDEGTEAVLVFFARERIEEDPQLLETMAYIEVHLARVFERRELERTIVELAERQQQRLGEELHDLVGQELTGVLMLAKSLEKQLEGSEAADPEPLARLVDAARNADTQLRNLMRGLVPPLVEPASLLPALERLTEQVGELYGLEVELRCDRELPPLADLAATALYRIASEALHNAAKHGAGGRVELRLGRRGTSLVLEVHDEGDGFDAGSAHSGLGLRLMRHRAGLLGGEIEITSDEEGTLVACRVPLAQARGGRGDG